jgi:diguanylate cyclase (GGDEF)-like protein
MSRNSEAGADGRSAIQRSQGWGWPSRHRLQAIAVWFLVTDCLLLGTALRIDRLRNDMLAAASVAAEGIAATAEQAVLRGFEAVQSLLELLAIKAEAEWAGAAENSRALDAHLRRIAEQSRFGVVQVSLAGLDGTIAWSSAQRPGAAPVSVADRESFRAPAEGRVEGLYVSEPQIGRITGRWGVFATRLLRNTAGEPRFVATVTLDPLALSALLSTQTDRPGRRVTVRRLADGAVIARSAATLEYVARPPAPDHPAVAAARRAPQGRLNYRTPELGQKVIGAFRVPYGLPLVVVASLDRGEELAGFWRSALPTVAICLVLAGIALRFAISWARSREQQDRLQEAADRDPLTGLFNRRAMEVAAAPLLRSASATGRPCAVLLFDLDHFKAVNDTYGHEAGDAVLRDVAAALRRHVRGDDLVCRWGGEELLVLLHDCSRNDAEARAEELRAAIADLYREGGGPVPAITTSVGVVTAGGGVLDSLVREADAALYAAKRAGRNRVVVGEAVPA